MAKNKGIARAAKQLRREQAEERNAQTPDERRRANRLAKNPPEKAANRARQVTPQPLASPVIEVNIAPAPPKRRPPAPPPTAAAAAYTVRSKKRRRPKPELTPKKVAVAPARITDGIKPNHAARAQPLISLFVGLNQPIEPVSLSLGDRQRIR